MPVAYLAGNDQLLIVEFRGLAWIPQGVLGSAKVAENDAFPTPVAYLAKNYQRSFVKLNGLAWLAQIEIGIAERPDGGTFSMPFANLDGYAQSLLSMDN